MYATPDKMFNAGKTTVDAALSLAQTQLAAMEKVTQIYVETTKSAFQDAADHIRSVIAAKDAQEFMQLNAAYAQPSVEKAIGYAKEVYDVAAQTQASVVKVFDTQSAEMNKALGTAIDSLSKNAPAGSEAAVNAIKSTLAAFNAAYDSASRVAKQTTDAFDHQFATATHATRETAIKRKAR